ncbi:uncharacterized protein WM277_021587 isoform 2-T2 [Molossus nigricans]
MATTGSLLKFKCYMGTSFIHCKSKLVVGERGLGWKLSFRHNLKAKRNLSKNLTRCKPDPSVYLPSPETTTIKNLLE